MNLNGSAIAVCYKIFNTKADGACGKLQNIVVHCYHTTSQFFINGHEIDIYLTELRFKLCDELKRKYTELDIMNINIVQSIFNMDANKLSVLNIKAKAIEPDNKTAISENVKADMTNDSFEISELCPVRQK